MNLFLKGFISTLVGFGLIALAKDHVCLVYSETDSLPCHYFLKLKRVAPKKGHYTMIESPWYGGKVIKEIIGEVGDEINHEGDESLWVGEQKIGELKKMSRDGRPLTPLKASSIPEGYVFLKGDHERSFDSRYEEFGLIPVNDLQGRVIGVW